MYHPLITIGAGSWWWGGGGGGGGGGEGVEGLAQGHHWHFISTIMVVAKLSSYIHIAPVINIFCYAYLASEASSLFLHVI